VVALPAVRNWWPEQKITNPSWTIRIRLVQDATDPVKL
jgi:hypothetical protein